MLCPLNCDIGAVFGNLCGNQGAPAGSKVITCLGGFVKRGYRSTVIACEDVVAVFILGPAFGKILDFAAVGIDCDLE